MHFPRDVLDSQNWEHASVSQCFSEGAPESCGIAGTLPSLPFKREATGSEALFHNRITGDFMVCRGVTKGGKVGTIPRASNHCRGAQSLWGRRITAGGVWKSQQYHTYFLQWSTFASERHQVRTWGAKLASGLGSHLTSLCPWWFIKIDLKQIYCSYSCTQKIQNGFLYT